MVITTDGVEAEGIITAGAIIATDCRRRSAIDCHSGMRLLAQTRNLEMTGSIEIPGSRRSLSSGRAALARLPGVDGVFAANDAHAIGFMSGLRAAGLLLQNGPAAQQPVAVIGLGDLEMGQLIAPSLSTIRVHGDAIGRTAAKLMLTRTGPRHVDLGFELVLRDSG
jgi:DNA-binding LacI/PurR family transcriptional regulator